MKKLNVFIIFLLTWIFAISCFAQNDEVKIANEYYLKGELEKAKESFEKLAKKPENTLIIYKNYYLTLENLKDFNELEKFVKRTAKSYPENVFYKIDHAIILSDYINKSSGEKEFQGLVNQVKTNPSLVEQSAEYLIRKGKVEQAMDFYLSSRKAINDKTIYATGLANIYKLQNKPDLMIEELLNYLKVNQASIESVKNTLQNNLKDKEEFEVLEKVLYDKIQREPEELSYNELLLWLNIQQKNFSKAFMQAKAIDRRSKTNGAKLLEVGKIALENKDYENSIKFFQHIINEYKTGFNYPIARKLLINAREELVKNTFPVEDLKIKALINEYLGLIKELPQTPTAVEAMRNIALLHAFYLNNMDTAIVILNNVILMSRGDEKLKNKAKIDLGDIYLLKGEPWESSLLYSQVEKAQKEDVLGHEAKLRNAKLAYYAGEFTLAQEHLDVLKLATSREIANDAMDLSLLIQDNMAMDTSGEAMKEYASIDLLLFQNKNAEALAKLTEMQTKYKGHSLSDEILWLKAKIYKKTGDYTSAISTLEEINNNYSQDILGDDALFLTANIYEENLKNKEKAMELYQSFLLKYPGSIFGAEARKRYRLLRGDKL